MKICYICHVTKLSSTRILLGSLLLLMSIDNKLQAVGCAIFPCVDDICLLNQHWYLKRIKEGFTKNISNIYDWFVNYKLCIQFVEAKAKSFSLPRIKKERCGTLDIKYGDIENK